MTNYTRFPKWRYNNGSIVICFNYHRYSWTTISVSQLKYLKNNYCDDAIYIYLKYFNGHSLRMSVSEFRECINDDFKFDYKKACTLIDASSDTLENKE